MGYKVTAPIVTARTENDRIVYLYFGDMVPSGLSKDSVAHLKSLGFLKPEDDAPAVIEQPEPVVVVPVVGGDVDKPAGNAGLPAWASYARSRGATDADLEGLSRDDVRELYK